MNNQKLPMGAALLMAVLGAAAEKCTCAECTARRNTKAAAAAVASVGESSQTDGIDLAPDPGPRDQPFVAPPSQHAYNLAACIANLGLEGAELSTEFNGKRYGVTVHVDDSFDAGC